MKTSTRLSATSSIVFDMLLEQAIEYLTVIVIINRVLILKAVTLVNLNQSSSSYNYLRYEAAWQMVQPMMQF
jgi:hypothetical protein